MTVVMKRDIVGAIEASTARHRIRLRNPETGAFLHCSGAGTTFDATWAWSGFRRQARALRARAEAQGEHWPYRIDEGGDG